MTDHVLRHLLLPGAVLGLACSLIAALLGAVSPTAGTPVDGVWQTDGYGSVVAIENGAARHYETTTISCVPGTSAHLMGPVGGDGTVRFAGDERSFTVRATGERGALHLEGSVGDQHLRRLPRLPEVCARPGPTGPVATFDVFWATYSENYPFFTATGVDWDAVRDRYRPRVRQDMSDDELFDLLVEMIEPLGDAHTGVRAGERGFTGHRPGTTFPTLELENTIRPFIERRDLNGRPLTTYGNERIGYADLPGRIGYLRVVAFVGYGDAPTYESELSAMDAALDAVLTPRRTSGAEALQGLVIDLRVNGGGSDELALRLGSRLTDQPYLAYLKRARNDAVDPTRFTPLQAHQVVPAGGPRYTGPIVVLTGGSTISAGETFTLALMDRSPRPVRIGDNTQGVFSDTLVRTLPGGWQFILPNEEFRTRTGQSFDGPGVPPDRRTPVFTDEELSADRDSAFDEAIVVLSRG